MSKALDRSVEHKFAVLILIITSVSETIRKAPLVKA